MNPLPSVAILHYSAPPVIGGVEAVMAAHARLLVEAGYPTGIIAGRGAPDALPAGVEFIPIPLMDSQHPDILAVSAPLEVGTVPHIFAPLTRTLQETLSPVLRRYDFVIIHNVFTKHFNLPLTAALHRLLDAGTPAHAIAWCHDFTWGSPNSGHKVHPGDPWDLLRTRRADTAYVVVSEQRRQNLAELFACPPEKIVVGYNGVEPQSLLRLSAESMALIHRLDLFARDLILLMPVRVTQAKHIEYALRVVAALKAHIARPLVLLTGPPDPHDAASMAYYEALRALRQELGVEDAMRFVFESGPEPAAPYTIGLDVVGDLYRISDALFMPSHREGFGMPILEAGLVGLPVFCTNAVPAGVEIGGDDVVLFDPTMPPEAIAARIAAWAADSPQHALRRRVRQSYTWHAIFERVLVPLLQAKGTP